MDDHCLVISGDWVYGEGGKWDFINEKHQMGRMVHVYEGMGFKELEGNVLHEFKDDEGRFHVSSSYGPPESFELATRIRTPPDVDTEVVDDSGMGFVSLEAAKFLVRGEFGSRCS
ncbi:hypothetical protein YC2023_081715 [Brassica napus]